MKLIYYGHSCFNLVSNDFSIVFDPYKDESVPGLVCPNIECDTLLISHEHDDHNCREKCKLISPQRKINIDKINVPHDKCNGILRGMNYIHKINVDGITIAHLGDIGTLNEDVMNFLKDADVILCPINGFYTIGYLEAIAILNRIKPKLFIPMHYWDNETGYFDNNQIILFKNTIQDFISLDKNEIEIENYLLDESKVLIFERR